jgi:hypothetical protein
MSIDKFSIGYTKTTWLESYGFGSNSGLDYGILCYDVWDNFQDALWFETEAERDAEFNRLIWEV